MSDALRVAILVKQIPGFEEFELDPDGRMRREGLDLEMNAYCRRAVTIGVRLASESGGHSTVLTLGPPAAEDVLREAVAWGADDGVLVSDPAFAGSDTLATARTLAAALRRLGPFDLVVCGRNSLDADTGQVPGELAEMLDLPLLTGVRELEREADLVRARLEHDDGWTRAEVRLPAVITAAERLCEPCKVEPELRAAVDGARLRRLAAADLGRGPWGETGSPTRVGEVRGLAVSRERRVDLRLHLRDQVRRVVSMLDERRIFEPGSGPDRERIGVPPARGVRGRAVAVVTEPGRGRLAAELLTAAARCAAEIGGHAVAVAVGPADPEVLAAQGADALVDVRTGDVEEDVAGLVATWCETTSPWAVLVPGTMWGREVAARIAARLGAGLVGDAVDLDVEHPSLRLIAWKPAFGGGLVAEVLTSTAVQMATVRSGVLPLGVRRPAASVPTEVIGAPPRGRVRILARGRDDELDRLAIADAVVGVGTGITPDEYPQLQPLLDALGAELAATRKVTDRGWQPRSRQVGITGRSIAPQLYVAVGMAGKHNHLVGVRGAATVVAVNSDPDAPIFAACDAGIVGDWRVAVPMLVDALRARARRPAAAVR